MGREDGTRSAIYVYILYVGPAKESLLYSSVPPRVKRGMGTEEEPATTAEIVNRAQEMDLKDLQKLLIASGHLKSEHI
jgi:hypothetical protein